MDLVDTQPVSRGNPGSPRLAEHIELWEVGRLIPSARNPRTHTDEQIAQIAKRISKYGFIIPIVVDAQGSIIAGHARARAAGKLKLARVPVIIVDHLSPAEQRAYAIADNQLALNAAWDEELLLVELESLRNDGFDLDNLGFSEDDLNALLDQLKTEGGLDEEAVPEISSTPVSRTGDLWLLGEHRLLCGDALDATSYPALLGGESASMVFADPPYGVNYTAPGLGVGIMNDNLGGGFGPFLETACRQMLAHTRGAFYLSMSSSELHTLHGAFTRAGGHWSTFLIWGKNTFTLGRSDYQRQFEPILYGWVEGKPHYWCGARDQGDLWLIDRPQVNDLHPTMKPVELVARAVVNSSRRGELVLDPFAGSGSTLIACEKTGRRARLMEIDPKYADVIVRRWEEFTGGTATLQGSSESFSGVARERLSVDSQEVKA